MAVHMIVSMVAMAVAMRMTMMRVTTHCQNTEEIDAQSYGANQEKLISVHFWRIQTKD